MNVWWYPPHLRQFSASQSDDQWSLRKHFRHLPSYSIISARRRNEYRHLIVRWFSSQMEQMGLFLPLYGCLFWEKFLICSYAGTSVHTHEWWLPLQILQGSALHWLGQCLPLRHLMQRSSARSLCCRSSWERGQSLSGWLSWQKVHDDFQWWSGT